MLRNVTCVGGGEMVKFLQDTLDCLFDILNSNSEKYDELVFSALVSAPHITTIVLVQQLGLVPRLPLLSSSWVSFPVLSGSWVSFPGYSRCQAVGSHSQATPAVKQLGLVPSTVKQLGLIPRLPLLSSSWVSFPVLSSSWVSFPGYSCWQAVGSHSQYCQVVGSHSQATPAGKRLGLVPRFLVFLQCPVKVL